VRGLIDELKATVELLKLNKQSQPEEEVIKTEFYLNPCLDVYWQLANLSKAIGV
jgi:hypothetical protein